MALSHHNMKPVFCIDITSNKNNDVLNGSEFITCTASRHKIEAYENKQANLENTIKKSKLPPWLQIAKYLSSLFFLIVLGASARAGLDMAMKNAPILVISGVLCGILGLVLHVISKRKESKVLNEENAEQQSEDIDADFKSIHDEMNVPEDAVEIDVLGFRYKLKNGEIRPKALGFQTTAHTNVSVKIYATPDEVHVADLENVYSFQKSELRAIVTVNKRISVPTWSKDEDPRKGIFKPYKMTVNNMGDVFFKPFHILEIVREGQLYGLYFPCYELETVEKLTGLKAQE